MMFYSTRIKNVALSITAGLLGGLISHFVSPAPAQAQDHVNVVLPSVLEVRAQKFVLVNAQGVTGGVLEFQGDGTPTLTLFDRAGHTIWSSTPRGYQLVK